MKKIVIILIALFVFLAVWLVWFYSWQDRKSSKEEITISSQNNPPDISVNPGKQNSPETPANQGASDIAENRNTAPLQPPLDRSHERVTKKPFGIFITPQTSPVQPEKFRGYHTGTDFEIFPEELNSDVPIKAICSGKLALKKTASGYGGVAVQNCNLKNEPVAVVYGHLRLASVSKSSGENLNVGETIGFLGKNNSSETDGERKHLHLSLHKGNSINIRGYVDSQAQLSGWIDPCLYVCR